MLAHHLTLSVSSQSDTIFRIFSIEDFNKASGIQSLVGTLINSSGDDGGLDTKRVGVDGLWRGDLEKFGIEVPKPNK